jgi:hypothetical protein
VTQDELNAAIHDLQGSLRATDNRREMLEDGRILAMNLDGVGEHNIATEVRNAMTRLRARLDGGE